MFPDIGNWVIKMNSKETNEDISKNFYSNELQKSLSKVVKPINSNGMYNYYYYFRRNEFHFSASKRHDAP